jgi:hypothetical protein
MSEVGCVMNVHPNLVSVGYKFSIVQKNNPVSGIKHAEALGKLFQDTTSLAIAAEKPGHRPFKGYGFTKLRQRSARRLNRFLQRKSR